jgi:hypothetical protein
MKKSEYEFGPKDILPDPEYVDAWGRIEKALGIEVDPDMEMQRAVVSTLAIMAERIGKLECK